MCSTVFLGSIRRYGYDFAATEKIMLETEFQEKLYLHHLSAEHLNIKWIEKPEADTIEYICFIYVSEKLVELERRENLRKIIQSDLWFEQDTNK